MSDARVTVITPTIKRRRAKLHAAAASVRAQTFEDWRHLIIADGPGDSEFRRDLIDIDDLDDQCCPRGSRVRCLFLGAHHDTPGHWNRLLGGLAAKTDYIAYLDDDNTWRPRHLELAVHALDKDPSLGFVHTLMQRPADMGGVLGADRLRPGWCVNFIDASMLVHRRELLADVATWDPHMAPPNMRYALDGFLVERWLVTGVRYAQIPEVTVDYSGVGYYLDGGGAPQ